MLIEWYVEKKPVSKEVALLRVKYLYEKYNQEFGLEQLQKPIITKADDVDFSSYLRQLYKK